MAQYLQFRILEISHWLEGTPIITNGQAAPFLVSREPISPSVEKVFIYKAPLDFQTSYWNQIQSNLYFWESNHMFKKTESSHNFPKTSEIKSFESPTVPFWSNTAPFYSLTSPSRSQEMLRHNASSHRGTKQFTKSNFYLQGNMVNPHFPWLTITSLLLKSSFWLVKFRY